VSFSLARPSMADSGYDASPSTIHASSLLVTRHSVIRGQRTENRRQRSAGSRFTVHRSSLKLIRTADESAAAESLKLKTAFQLHQMFDVRCSMLASGSVEPTARRGVRCLLLLRPRTEDGGQRSVVRGRWSVARGQRTEDRGQRSEIRRSATSASLWLPARSLQRGASAAMLRRSSPNYSVKMGAAAISAAVNSSPCPFRCNFFKIPDTFWAAAAE